MTFKDALSLYIGITHDIHIYWMAFGGIATVFIGWILLSIQKLNNTQKIFYSIGYFTVSAFIISRIMSRYWLLDALIKDINILKLTEEIQCTNLLEVVTHYGPVYSQFSKLVWLSYSLISALFLVVIWGNLVWKYIGKK